MNRDFFQALTTDEPQFAKSAAYYSGAFATKNSTNARTACDRDAAPLCLGWFTRCSQSAAYYSSALATKNSTGCVSPEKKAFSDTNDDRCRCEPTMQLQDVLCVSDGYIYIYRPLASYIYIYLNLERELQPADCA